MRNDSLNMHNHKGFTLVEIVIVMVIVSILAAIAIPNYMDSVRKTKRLDAVATLSQLSQAMERFYGVNYTYLGAASGGSDTGAPATATFGFTQSPTQGAAAYNLTISAATATSFSVQAAPVGSQTSDSCGTLTLASSGNKTDGGGGIECWR